MINQFIQMLINILGDSPECLSALVWSQQICIEFKYFLCSMCLCMWMYQPVSPKDMDSDWPVLLREVWVEPYFKGSWRGILPLACLIRQVDLSHLIYAESWKTMNVLYIVKGTIYGFKGICHPYVSHSPSLPVWKKHFVTGPGILLIWQPSCLLWLSIRAM